MVLEDPAPRVFFMGFGPSSMDFEIRCHLRDVNFSLSAKSDMNYEIVERFAREGIEIPFPQQDIRIRDADRLAAALRAGAPAPESEPAPEVAAEPPVKAPPRSSAAS
jgi:small-conductance mechanosensitive channel